MAFDPIVMFCKVGKWVTFLILLLIGNCYKIGVFVHRNKQFLSNSLLNTKGKGYFNWVTFLSIVICNFCTKKHFFKDIMKQ